MLPLVDACRPRSFSREQILKGQAVLTEIKAALTKKNKSSMQKLSNKFNSLIPMAVGRAKAPMLDTVDKVIEKEGLLEFWLRMGFEKLGDEMVGSPIEGVHELPVPTTLASAAASIADARSIASSRARGKQLAKSKAGSPVQKMGPELYAAILLYTGNSIYREINRCLRSDWHQAKKYWSYLRMYFEATQCMPMKDVRFVPSHFADGLRGGEAVLLTLWFCSCGIRRSHCGVALRRTCTMNTSPIRSSPGGASLRALLISRLLEILWDSSAEGQPRSSHCTARPLVISAVYRFTHPRLSRSSDQERGCEC
jgi:hypothetical protein